MSYSCEVDIIGSLDWQRSRSVFLKNTLQAKQDWYVKNHCKFWEDWVKDVFDLRTANDFGLAVWAIILDEPIGGVVKASPIDYPAFGFGPDRENFNNGNFATSSDAGYNFTTEEKRILLQLKAYVLHMSGSVFDINEALERIFGAGSIVCIDNQDMSFTYIVYDLELTALIREIKSRDLLPRPSCIDIKVVLNGNALPFGFGDNRANFNNGNFNDGELV